MMALNFEIEGNKDMLQEIKNKVNKYKLFSGGNPGLPSLTNKHDLVSFLSFCFGFLSFTM